VARSPSAGAAAPNLAECVQGKPMRADARRNYDKLVAAARAEFASRGTGASLEEIARRAEVGVGTLYRKFPNRQALLEAVYLEEVEALCRSAADYAETDPWDALTAWFGRFIDYVATKHALAEEMLSTMSKDAPVFRTCHDAIFSTGEALLNRAKDAGVVRPDVEPAEVLALVSGVTMVRNTTPEQKRRVLAVALDGLRYGAPAG
jgi:AcrR family transcriptional regulator